MKFEFDFVVFFAGAARRTNETLLVFSSATNQNNASVQLFDNIVLLRLEVFFPIVTRIITNEKFYDKRYAM